MDDHVLFRSLKGTSPVAEKAAVNAWRRESDENERRYLEIAEVLAAASRAEQKVEAPPPSPLKLIHQAESSGASGGTLVGRRSSPWHGVPAMWPRWALAVAALLVLTIAVGRHQPGNMPVIGFESEEFVTGSAEAATVTLSDGTIVRLGPQSRLRVTSGKGRDVSLWGRALFSVARDPDRIFRIETPAGTVEVLGTRFELEAHDQDLRIAVIEGLVALSARGQRTEVQAGEMRRVVGGATLPAVHVPKEAAVGDWVGNFLAFRDTPVSDAVAEIEMMYGVRIEINDPALARQTITAWFSDQPLDQVMTIFCMVAQATCTSSSQGDLITLEYGQRR
jgi:transmembrane sensor